MTFNVLKNRHSFPELHTVVTRIQEELFIDPSHLIKLLNFVIATGKYGYSTLQDLLDSTFDKQKCHGFWLLRTTENKFDDEYGWCCIHWPTLIRHFVNNDQTSQHLKAHGFGPRRMQKMSLRELEGAYRQFDAFKARLLAALPPGSLLEADNSFFQQLVGAFVDPEDYEAFDNSPLEASTRCWSFFRFGALARTSENTFESACSRLSVLNALSISKIDSELLDACPDVIKTLLTVCRLARNSNGKGWQRYGLAWTKAGLVFNYQIALNTLYDDNELYSTLFPGERGGPQSPAGRWLNPVYLLSKPRLRGIPALGTICRSDRQTQQYIHTATAPYKMLFQDVDPTITANGPYHSTDMRYLFRIDHKDKNNLLTYLRQLITLSENKIGGEDVYEIPTINPNAKPNNTNKGKTVTHTVYPVRFNALNLSYQSDRPIEPYEMVVCPYKGSNYFSLPNGLVEALPVLLMSELYQSPQRIKKTDEEIITHKFQWSITDEEQWHVRLLKKKELDPSVKRVNVFGYDLTLPAKDIPWIHNVQGNVYFHSDLFAPDNPFMGLLDTIRSTRPDASHVLNNEIETFKNFWTWVYNPVPNARAGKYEQEFAFPIGANTKHCPADKRLDTAVKRLQFIVDKAMHALDEPVAFLPEKSGDRKAPRSKKVNSYDEFIFWYVAFHEIAKLPWMLDAKEQGIYITKRWMPWRRPLSATKYLVNPYAASKPKKYDRPDMETVFAYAKENFVVPFTQI